MANLGPMPMISGGTPATAKPRKRASGCRLKRLSAASLTTTTAPAPSEVCELLPAVTLPFAAKAGRSLASTSREVSARGPSSAATVRVTCLISSAARSGTFSSIV